MSIDRSEMVTTSGPDKEGRFLFLLPEAIVRSFARYSNDEAWMEPHAWTITNAAKDTIERYDKADARERWIEGAFAELRDRNTLRPGSDVQVIDFLGRWYDEAMGVES